MSPEDAPPNSNTSRDGTFFNNIRRLKPSGERKFRSFTDGAVNASSRPVRDIKAGGAE